MLLNRVGHVKYYGGSNYLICQPLADNFYIIFITLASLWLFNKQLEWENIINFNRFKKHNYETNEIILNLIKSHVNKVCLLPKNISIFLKTMKCLNQSYNGEII